MPIGLHLLRRGRTYFFRCRLPADIAARARRQEVVRTLRTRDPAVARLHAAIIAIRLTELWAQVRMTVTAEDIERVLDAWFKRAVESAWKPLGAGTFAVALLPDGASHDELGRLNRELFRQDAELELDRLSEAYRDGDFGAGHHVANHIADRLGLPADDRRRTIMAKSVVEALGQLEEARIRWAEGDVAFTPRRRVAAPAPASASHPTARGEDDADSPTLAESIDRYLDHVRRERNLTARMLGQTQSELRVMQEALGATTNVSTVTRRQAGVVFEGLRVLPARFREHPSLKGLPFAEMVAQARTLSLPPMHPRTVKGYIATMSAFFEAEKMAGRVAENPFAGMRLKAPKLAESEREFTAGELSVILGSPLFMGAKSLARPYEAGDVPIGTWQFWAVMIALLTGMRIGEIAQLRPDDVRQQDGVWVLDVNVKHGKRLKTASSVRRVPIHSELVRLGLLQLAEQQHARGHLTLLPEAPKAVGGDPAKQHSKWMSETFLPRLGINRDRAGFHSFRHSLRTMLRSADVNERVADRITGHSARGVGGSYGSAELKAMAAALEKVVLPPELAKVPSRR